MNYRRDRDNEEAERVLEEELNAYSKPAKKSSGHDCHYCGCEATGFDYFDEPICNDCQ